MVTADSVKSKIRGLIDKSNAKTGHIDKDLTAAVDTLIAGYGEDGTALPEIDPSILGTSNDLVSGKQLIDASGGIVTGTIPETSVGLDFKESSVHFVSSLNDIRLVNTIDEDILMRSGSKVYVNAEATEFGDAAASDVAKGKTFTSQNGLKVVGIREDDGGVTLPTLTNPASASDMAYGKQLIDSSGNVVTGTVKDSRSWYGTYSAEPEIYTPGSYKYIMFKLTPTETTMVKNTVELCANVSKFGDATSSDVLVGKTFTSREGLKVVGTMAPGSGGDFTVTDDGAGNVTITSSAITDNNGNVVIA